MISQIELARRLGVSQTAVSAALRHTEKASRLTPALAERIRLRARKLGYRTNLLARSLAQRKTHTIGVVVSDFSDPTFGCLLNHLQTRALKVRHELIVTGCGENAEEMYGMWERLMQRRVDAVLWIDQPHHTSVSRLKTMWSREALPIVAIGSAFRRAGVAAVVFDSRQATHLLAEQIYRRRVTQVVFLKGRPGMEFSQWRWKCVREIRGVRTRQLDFQENTPINRILSFRRSGEILALIGDHDFTALRALYGLLTIGLRPRQDFILGSFDGLSWLTGLCPRLTSVRQPLEAMAERAIQRALSRKIGKSSEFIPGDLLEGDTL